MIDFHSHILPAIDDGSQSIEQSLAMLQESARQGVTYIVASPHYYCNRQSPEQFLQMREESWENLSSYLRDDYPRIFKGAEVYFFPGISNLEILDELCIQGTNTLLLEMPFQRWSEYQINEVIDLTQTRDIQLVLAHVDRYFPYQEERTWEILENYGIHFQMNTAALLGNWFNTHKNWSWIRNERISVLGSDCHNMDKRPPNMEIAKKRIIKKEGHRLYRQIERRGRYLLNI